MPLVSHSIPSARHLPGFTLAALEKEDLGPPDFVPGGAVHALVWGRDVGEANATAFLAKVGADWLITGHIPCEEGYMVPNSRQIILDALGTPACYCLFPTDRALTQAELVACIGAL